MQVALGAVVRYTLTVSDVETILHSRTRSAAHTGSIPSPGEILPLVVTRLNGGTTTKISGQVLLNGSDSLWVQDALQSQYPRRGCWCWPEELAKV